MRWFYYMDEEGRPCWRGSHELSRYSSVISRQRSFTVFGRRFFWRSPEVEMEVIWRFARTTSWQP